MATQNYYPNQWGGSAGVGRIDLATGRGSDPELGNFTFTPGVTMEQALSVVQALHMDVRNGVLTDAGTAGGPGGITTSAAPGGAASGGPFGSLLRQYELDELVPMVDAWTREGLTWPEIESQLLDIATPAGKVVDKMYPEIRMRREAKLAPMSISQIQGYRTAARQMFRAAGLPAGFYDSNEDFQGFITGDVSVNELAARVNDGFLAVGKAPAEVRAAFGDFFGASGDSALAAYFLDKDKALPVLEQQVAMSQVAGAGRQFGITLERDRASRIAGNGVGFDQARSGFSTLANSAAVFEETISEVKDLSAAREGVDAVFDLDQGQAKKEIGGRVEGRVAAFSGVGGAATSERGSYGLGSARR